MTYKKYIHEETSLNKEKLMEDGTNKPLNK